MKIVFIVPYLRDGGAEKQASAFANELARIGEDVSVICIDDTEDEYILNELVHRLSFHATRIQIRFIKGICNEWRMRSLLKNIRPDVVLPFYVPFHLAVILSGSRMIYTVRGNIEQEFWKTQLISKRLACRFAKAIWIQTKEQRSYFPQHMQEKLFEVHNILDQRFLQIRRFPSKKILNFISVGRLHPSKNYQLLIAAFHSLIRQMENPSVTLTIYGRADREHHWVELELKDQIKRLKLENKVFLPGHVTDIERRYEVADAFILSSNYEGCPNALMEAMAAGLPCISTDCSTGPSMLIDNGKNGLLVPVGDVEALTSAMKDLVENTQKANRIGIAARESMSLWGNPREQAQQLLDNLRRITYLT